jgi:hypothetical protein
MGPVQLLCPMSGRKVTSMRGMGLASTTINATIMFLQTQVFISSVGHVISLGLRPGLDQQGVVKKNDKVHLWG